SRHRTLMNLFDKVPVVDKNAFVAPSASIVGDVYVGPNSSIWYGCVLRGDANSISIGSGTNIQDNSLVHVAKSNLGGKVLPILIGDNVTVGHTAILHGCTVEDEAFVGMGATLLDGVVVEKHAMVAAGALVRQNTRIPSRQKLHCGLAD
ncbi:GAMMA carbonic anhydrase, partial [Striga asiatica]